MTDLAERTTEQEPLLHPELEYLGDRAPTPPEGRTPIERMPAAPWPRKAKMVIAGLAVLAFAGAAGTVIGLTQDDPSTADLESEVATLTDENAALRSANDELVLERDAADADAAALAIERDDLATDVADLTTERDDLATDVADLTTERDSLATDVADLTTERDSLATDVADLTTERDDLAAALLSTQLRAAEAEAERDALAALFPVDVDTSLVGVDVRGTYDVSLTEAFCGGLSTCGTLPDIDELRIFQGPAGLEIDIDGYVTAGMFRVENGLYAVADTTSILPACDGAPRVSRVAITVFASSLAVADDGTQLVEALGAALSIQADATGSCGPVVTIYGAELTPR